MNPRRSYSRSTLTGTPVRRESCPTVIGLDINLTLLSYEPEVDAMSAISALGRSGPAPASFGTTGEFLGVFEARDRHDLERFGHGWIHVQRADEIANGGAQPQSHSGFVDDLNRVAHHRRYPE